MDLPTRPRTRPAGVRASRPEPHPAFLLAVASLGVSVVVFLAVVVTAACGGDGNGGLPTSGAIGTPTDPGSSAPDSATAESTTPAATSPTPAPTDTPEPGGDPSPTPTAGIEVPCGDILAPLDKQHRLAADCAPGDLVALPPERSYNGTQQLRGEAADALITMLQAAEAEGHAILARSTYRSYEDQVATYNLNVQQLGQAEADRVSARPGHSEHQLGTTADLTSASVSFELDQAFGDTDEGRWLAENSWRFGFIISYPDGKEPITGYAYEPWHVRWIGEAEAASVAASGLTLHEYLLMR
jgi:D-alanyl-D-alanine carboxypeptidase